MRKILLALVSFVFGKPYGMFARPAEDVSVNIPSQFHPLIALKCFGYKIKIIPLREPIGMVLNLNRAK